MLASLFGFILLIAGVLAAPRGLPRFLRFNAMNNVGTMMPGYGYNRGGMGGPMMGMGMGGPMMMGGGGPGGPMMMGGGGPGFGGGPMMMGGGGPGF